MLSCVYTYIYIYTIYIYVHNIYIYIYIYIASERGVCPDPVWMHVFGK